MKTQLVVKPHHMLPGEFVVELWYRGEFLGTVAGADGPGVRVISKHLLAPGNYDLPFDGTPNVVEVMISR